MATKEPKTKPKKIRREFSYRGRRYAVLVSEGGAKTIKKYDRTSFKPWAVVMQPTAGMLEAAQRAVGG